LVPGRHGDAAFADYLILIGYWRKFWRLADGVPSLRSCLTALLSHSGEGGRGARGRWYHGRL